MLSSSKNANAEVITILLLSVWLDDYENGFRNSIPKRKYKIVSICKTTYGLRR